MATFELTGPDGGTYHIDAPDEGAALDAFHTMNGNQGSSLSGVAKSLGTGAVEGGVGLAGLPGDLTDLGAKGIGAASDYISDKLGVPKYVRPSAPSVLNNIPTGASLQKNVDDATGGLYQPKGTLEETAQKVGQFLPALIGGPETLAAKTTTRVIAPAVASEAAGKLTEGTPAQPYAELAAALAGGAGASSVAQKFNAMAAARNAAKAVPSAEDLLTSGSNKFEAVKASDAVIKPASVEQMAKDIKTELLNDGKHPTSEGQTGVFSALDRLEAMGATPGGVTPKDMEIIRKNLVDLKTNPNPSGASAARAATNSFMDKYSSMGPADLLNGSNPFPTLKEAIGDWAAGKRSNTVMGKAALGTLNAETAGSGANLDNALRQSIKQLVRPVNNDIMPKAQRLGFNKPEIEAMNTAARGTVTGNAARYIGKAAPTGIVSGLMSTGAGHMAGGPIGAVALPAAGYIAKKIGDLSTKRAIGALDSLVRSRSPLAAHVAAQLPPQIVQQLPAKSIRLLRTMILADPVLQSVNQPENQKRQQIGQAGA